MNDSRARFTKWYYRKGYRMSYKPNDTELIFSCPLVIRPLVYFLFSPSVYYRELGYDFSECFLAGLRGVLNGNYDAKTL